MKKYIVIAVIALSGLAQNAYSQQPGYLSFQYAMGFGAGDLSDYISQASFRGFLFEYRGEVSDKFLVGVDLGWNVFYQDAGYSSYTDGTRTLSGNQYRYQNEFPMLLSAEYFFSTDNPFRPYAGLGLGTIYVERATDMGTWRLTEEAWNFALKPEVGFIYEMSYTTSAKVGLKYYYGMASGDFAESQNYLSLSVGLAFNL